MSIEGLLDSASRTPSDKENEVHEDNIIRFEGKERLNTESAIKKRIRSQINSVAEGSFFSTSPGSFLLGGDRKRSKR